MHENQPTSNSYEGTVAILLALLGLGGTGALQVLPHPYNDYVGWTLIWVAIIGAVALGVYHVSRTVEAPKYDPKPSKRIPMTAAEAGFLTALGATAISLIALGLRYRSTAAVLALIACVAVAFDFVDRQWFWESAPTERSLEADNSRIDVIRWQPILNDQKQLAVNIGLANNGKKTIREWTYDGSTATGAPGLLDRDLVDAIYIVLHRKVDSRVKSKMELTAGQNDQFITIPNAPPFVQLDDNTLQAYKNGALAVYILLLVQYKDDLTPSNKHLYTEKCAFVTQSVVHNCDVHNHAYIAN